MNLHSSIDQAGQQSPVASDPVATGSCYASAKAITRRGAIGDVTQAVLDCGACAVGIVAANTVSDDDNSLYDSWLALGRHARMDYMERNGELRRDPRVLMPGCRTIIAAAFNIRTATHSPLIADYAQGIDYHYVLKERLGRAAAQIAAAHGGEWRVVVDSAPMRERYWAQRAGIGYTGDNGLLIVPGYGSAVVLGFILWTGTLCPQAGSTVSVCPQAGSTMTNMAILDTAQPSSGTLRVPCNGQPILPPEARHAKRGATRPCNGQATDFVIVQPACGLDTNHSSGTLPTECLHCGRCAKACPGRALAGDGSVDARRCHSYLSIEHRGDFDDPAPRLRKVYGCDVCRRVCPLDQGPVTDLPEFQPDPQITGLTPDDMQQMGSGAFHRLTAHSPLARLRVQGLRRNAALIARKS